MQTKDVISQRTKAVEVAQEAARKQDQHVQKLSAHFSNEAKVCAQWPK
jgi:hypothetical protein